MQREHLYIVTWPYVTWNFGEISLTFPPHFTVIFPPELWLFNSEERFQITGDGSYVSAFQFSIFEAKNRSVYLHRCRIAKENFSFMRNTKSKFLSKYRINYKTVRKFDEISTENSMKSRVTVPKSYSSKLAAASLTIVIKSACKLVGISPV